MQSGSRGTSQAASTLNRRDDRVTLAQSLKPASRKIFEACMGQLGLNNGRVSPNDLATENLISTLREQIKKSTVR
jgi:hypothetical protein